MELVLDWNNVCLACLQEGKMKPIYLKDNKNTTICDMIMRCSNFEIQKSMNIPQQICSTCYEDLKAANRFRSNFESSLEILKSFLTVSQSANNRSIQSYDDNLNRFPKEEVLFVKEKVKREVIIAEKHSQSQEYIEYVSEGQNGNDMFDICGIQNNDDNDKYEDDQIESTGNVKIEYVEEPSEEITEFYTSEFDKNLNTINKHKSGETKQIKLNKAVNFKPKTSLSTKNQIARVANPTIKRKRGRPKTKIVNSNFDITPDNVSAMVKEYTTIAYVKKSNNEPKPLKICEICGNSYKYQHALDSHMRRHRNEKPFKCEICGRCFVANVELRRHMRVHTGQKPYSCKYCPRNFSDYGSRIKHERTHTGERPYECSTCGKSFAYAHVLTVHALTHTGEKKFKCEFCNKGFTKKIYLVAHINHNHMNEEYLVENHIIKSELLTQKIEFLDEEIEIKECETEDE